MATGKGNSFITDLLKLLFQNTAIANFGDAGGLQPSASAGNLYISLHTADPGVGGDQTTNEAAYTSYARVAVPRSSGGFTISGQTVSLTSAISFPVGTGGGETVTYLAIGTAASGSGEVLYRATLAPSIVTGLGITPKINTGAGITES